MREAGKYIILGLLILSVCFSKAHAQDPHFSQYFSSPLTFNPTFTGYFDGTQRFAFNMRSQTLNGGDPYITGTASFDTKILKNKIGSNDRWGLGILGLYDQSSGGIYKNTYLSLSTAFNKGLDANGDQSIGIGLQAGLGRKSIDFNNISFNSQFNGSGFDLSIPSGETVNNQSVSYVDLNAGILYNYRDESGNQFSFGAGMFHILRPKLGFFSNANPSLAPRYTIHAGAGFRVGEQDDFFISAHFMEQNGATESVIGGAYGFVPGESDMSLYIGTWLRMKDALYPYIGLRTPAYQLGLSYDIFNSDIRVSNRYSGSSELSFIYFFNKDRKKKGIPCFF